MINFAKQKDDTYYVDFLSREKKSKRRSIFKTIIISFLVTFLIFGSTGVTLILNTANGLRASIYENNIFFKGDDEDLSGLAGLGNTLMQLKDLTFTSDKDLKNDSQGWTNILLLGLPGGAYPGEALTDSVLIAMVDEENKIFRTISVPRDLVVVYKDGSKSKLNAYYKNMGSGILGTNALISKLNEITGLEIHYYARIDFEGFEKAIDTIGGVEVEVFEDIYDPTYPTANYGSEVFEIKKGIYNMDGKTALKYARTRHTSESDFGRSKRQQQVISLALDKIRGKDDLLNISFNLELFSIVKNHLKTNISLGEAKTFYKVVNTLDLNGIEPITIDNRESGLLNSASDSFLGSYLIPREGETNYESIKDFISYKRR